MRVVFSVKNSEGQRIQKEIYSSQQHFQFGNVDASVLFSEDGILLKIVEPFLPADPYMEEACEFTVDECPNGTVPIHHCDVAELSAKDICTFFECPRQQQEDTTKMVCYRHTVEINWPNES